MTKNNDISMEIESLLNKYKNVIKDQQMAIRDSNIRIDTCVGIVDSLEKIKQEIHSDHDND